MRNKKNAIYASVTVVILIIAGINIYNMLHEPEKPAQHRQTATYHIKADPETAKPEIVLTETQNDN